MFRSHLTAWAAKPPGVWRWLPVGVALLLLAALALNATDPALSLRAKNWIGWIMWPPFNDLKVVWDGIAADARGVDPLLSEELPYNYPRLWLATSGLGLHHVPVVGAGLVLAAAFLTLAGWILRVRTRGEAVIVTLLLVSPAVGLAVERGNIDLVIFLLVFGSLAFAPRPDQIARGAVAAAALLVAGMLKLYPAVTLLGGVAFSRGMRRGLFVIALVGFGLHVATHLTELGLVSQRTLRKYHASYGSNVVATGFRSHFFEDTWSADALRHFDRVAPATGLALFLALTAVAVGRGWKAHATFAELDCDERTRAWFWAGALIYCGSFALGNSFAYRLIFLLPCLPLIRAAVAVPAARRWGKITLIALFITLMKPLSPRFGWFLAVQPIQWMLAGLLAAGIAALARCENQNQRTTADRAV